MSKDSYVNRDRKHNADFMRSHGYGDVLANRKSIGRHGAKDRALTKKSKGNYSVFRYDSENHESKTRMKHGLSHSEMHHELKNNPEYRGNDKHGFMGGRTYSRKK